MAVTRKIDTLPKAITVANNDELIVMDVSESAVDMTKRMTMSQIPISLASQLGANVVENAKIRDGAVTNSKLGADAVDGTKIADNAIGNEHIRDSAALSVIGRSANSSGNPADIAAGADGYVLRRSGTTLGFGQVANAGIANKAVTAAKIADNTITASQIASKAVTAAEIADNTITASQIATNGVGNAEIADGAVSPAKTNFFGGSAIYWGAVAANGTGVSLPSGWSVSRLSVGHYRVNHPSWALNFPVVSSQFLTTVNALPTYFDVNTMNTNEFVDVHFWFVLIVG